MISEKIRGHSMWPFIHLLFSLWFSTAAVVKGESKLMLLWLDVRPFS